MGQYDHLDPATRHEAEVADSEYLPFADDLDLNPSMFEMYARPNHMWEWRERSAALLHPVDGTRLLDMGCGMGEEMVYFAKLGAQVTGIDVSEVGIDIARNRAAHNGLADRIDARIMRVDQRTEFEDDTFDRIHGLGILHHVPIEPVMAEVRRILKPGGIAVFVEPMGNNPVIETVKDWLVAKSDYFTQPTDNEYVFTMEQLRELGREFASFDLYPFSMIYRVRKLLPKLVWEPLKRLDHEVLAHVRPLAYFAGAAVFRFVK